MKSIYSCLLLLLFIFTFADYSLAREKDPPKKPNVILIMCDDLGWGDAGFNGSEVLKTPELDSLASLGTVMTRFYSASAVCSPTRASCITGRNPVRMNIPSANKGHMLPEENTLAEMLKEQGYTTGHFGKWHLGTLTTQMEDGNRAKPGKTGHYSTPAMNGYDEYFVTESKVPTHNPMQIPINLDKESGESRSFWLARSNPDETIPYGTKYWVGEEKYATENLEGDDAAIMIDRAIPFIDKAVENNMPFLSVIWIHTPHKPIVTIPEEADKYEGLSFNERVYYGSLSAMSKQVGRLYNHLDELGITENTILWFCSDNGPEKGTPGSTGGFRGRKRSLYEGGVRVPAFCVYPELIQPGSTTDVPMYTSDYLPTVLALLGVDYPDGRPIDGVNTTEILSGKQSERNAPMGFDFGKQYSWVDDQFKLYIGKEGQQELYDLIADPFETTDIKEEHPEVFSKMLKELEEWKISVQNSRQGNDYN